jgi:hypothetical protein
MNEWSVMKNSLSTIRGLSWVLWAAWAAWVSCPAQAAPKILYQSDFAKTELNQVPAGFLVLDGDFAVKESEGGKVLELPGAPLDTFGVLFGSATNAGVCVSARIYGTSKGRRAPSFGVGLNGAGGYKLKVSPGKNSLEIYKGDVSAASVPFDWKSGAWTMFRLRVRQVGGGDWKVEGKAWVQTGPEPKDWMISLDEKSPLRDGRPSIWGSPYSGTPIRFADLMVTTE